MSQCLTLEEIEWYVLHPQWADYFEVCAKAFDERKGAGADGLQGEEGEAR